MHPGCPNMHPAGSYCEWEIASQLTVTRNPELEDIRKIFKIHLEKFHSKKDFSEKIYW